MKPFCSNYNYTFKPIKTNKVVQSGIKFQIYNSENPSIYIDDTLLLIKFKLNSKVLKIIYIYILNELNSINISNEFLLVKHP
jgi:hypothetical protein